MRTESRNSNELVSKQWNSNVRQHLSLNYADVINWWMSGKREGEEEKEGMCAVRAWIIRRATIRDRKARKSEPRGAEERQNRRMITVRCSECTNREKGITKGGMRRKSKVGTRGNTSVSNLDRVENDRKWERTIL